MRSYPCQICGRNRPVDQLIRSRFTGNRYCATELKRCDARAKRVNTKEKP